MLRSVDILVIVLRSHVALSIATAAISRSYRRLSGRIRWVSVSGPNLRWSFLCIVDAAAPAHGRGRGSVSVTLVGSAFFFVASVSPVNVSKLFQRHCARSHPILRISPNQCACNAPCVCYRRFKLTDIQHDNLCFGSRPGRPRGLPPTNGAQGFDLFQRSRTVIRFFRGVR